MNIPSDLSAGTKGAIASRHWFASTAAASLLHICVLGLLSLTTVEGAEDQGEQGVEIDFGMLGDMGEMVETLAQSQAAAEAYSKVMPEEKIEEPIDPPKAPEPVPEPETETKPKEEKKIVKKAEVVQPVIESVQKKKSEKNIRKPVPEFVHKPAPPWPKTHTQPAKPVTARQKPAQTPSRPAIDSPAVAKISTGQAQAKSMGGNPGAERAYLALLAAKLRSKKFYPLSARLNKDEGEVTLLLTLGRDGQVLDARIGRSSGISVLDESVLQMLEKAKPLPPFPSSMQQSRFTVRIPVSFKLDQFFN